MWELYQNIIWKIHRCVKYFLNKKLCLSLLKNNRMKLTFSINQHDYEVNPAPLHISIPLNFNGIQPNSYGVPQAEAHAFEGGGFVGDVRSGGSCNFEIYTFIPHCNGTHTECVGHLTAERIAIHQTLNDIFIPATLISVQPTSGTATQDTYNPVFNPTDLVLDKAALFQALDGKDASFFEAMIIRTLPNHLSKKGRDYTKENAPFFSIEGMAYLRSLGIKHLLIDTPSVDRLHDEGKLSAHNVFFETNRLAATNNFYTITEFIFVEESILDGKYLLNLQIAPFMADAAPSRPVLMELLTE